MVADFEQGVGHELLSALRMGAHPLAAYEQRRRDMFAPQKIDGVHVVACGSRCQFAEIKCQRHGLRAFRQQHSPDGPFFLRRQGLQLHMRQTPFRWGAVVGQGTPQIGWRALPEAFRDVRIPHGGWLIGPAPGRQRRQTTGHNDAEDKETKPDSGIHHQSVPFSKV